MIVGPARDLVAHDLAADLAALLAAPAPGSATARCGRATSRCWCGTNDQGALVRDALAAAGVPAVLSGTVSVFATPVAADWLTLLEALEQPTAGAARARPR